MCIDSHWLCVPMEGLKPPGELSFEGNVSENWRKWRRQFENYLTAINLIQAPVVDADNPPAGNAAVSRRQIAVLLHTAGEEASEIASQFEYGDEEDANSLVDVLAKFDTYCNPRRNILYESFVFWTLSQKEGELVDTFSKRLKTQAAKCEFGALRERMLLCRLVFGLISDRLKERLLRAPDMTLERAMGDIRASEITQAQLSQVAMGDKTTASVAKIAAKSEGAKSNGEAAKFTCKFCGYQHSKGKCPAYGKTCNKCGGKNHFAQRCLSRSVKTIESEPDQQSQAAASNINSLFIGAVDSDKNSKTWTIPLMLCSAHKSSEVGFKIDTGAEANIVTREIVESLGGEIKPSTTTLVGYDKSVIQNVGQTLLKVRRGSQTNMTSFEVVDGHYPPILGLDSCIKFDIVKRVDSLTSLLDEYPDVFDGIGCMSDEHSIQVDDSVAPVVHAARRVPISIMDKVQNELDSMEESDIIAKVDQPSQWVNSMVVVEKKNGDVRICLDPRDLNKAILREHHHIPTLEDIAFKFSGMQHFTILDMKHGYWHIPLTHQSSLLTTFNTPFGRYRFKRLPFGLHSSAEVFEKRVEQLFGDLNVSIYFDDLIVAGRNQQEHDDNLKKLLARAREVNVKFNREKIQLNKPEVLYLGHIVSKEGLKPDPNKVKAIEQMPQPTDKTGIQRLLGTLNFLGPYLPNMSTLTQPLRVLLKKESVWSWGMEQTAALDAIKKLLVSEPVLKYFDINKPTQLQVDASQYGLGAVLLQDGHPIAYASRSLTSAEINYPQIDKELLAIVFGCERFNHYIYGRDITVQTDHSPLLSIIKKSIHKASPRLQRLLIRLQRYCIAEVKHVPGKHLYLADTLSRAYLRDETSEQLELEGEQVAMVHSLEITEDMESDLATAYEADPAMAALREACQHGWNWSSKRQVPLLLQPYWQVKDEIYECDNLLYVGERLVVPVSARKDMLRKVHQGHLGIQKCRERARRSVYWPGLSTDVQLAVSSCPSCAKFGHQQQKESLVPHKIPELPWNQVAMDIMEFRGNSFLVAVDCYSHFPELRQLRNKTASDVILALKSIFSVHGVPLTILADNMPFGSRAMVEFSKDWGFSINTSSPHYPRSNGMAERYVQTIKQFLKKSEDSDEDIYPSLLAYRETPVTGCIYSPAEMLFNRCIRSTLPITSQALRPTEVKPTEMLKQRQQLAKSYYDKSAKDLPALTTGDSVFMRTNVEKHWTPATVVGHHQNPRSYLVDNGQNLVRRNRIHLKNNHTRATHEELAQDEQEPFHSEAGNRTVPDQLDLPASPERAVSATPARRSQRTTRGVLPPRYSDYDMH